MTANSELASTLLPLTEREAMNQQQEALLYSHEQFFLDSISTTSTPGFCGDERPSELDGYWHTFGGIAAYLAYNTRVIQEAAAPGSTQDQAFESDVQRMTNLLTAQHIQVGIHSSEEAEGGDHIDPQHSSEINCGYLAKRQPISSLIANDPEAIAAEAIRQEPELLSSDANQATLHQLIAAHARIANTPGYFTTGRATANAALAAGASDMVVRGEHVGTEGIRNKVNGTTISTNQAFNAQMPTYEHDCWAVYQAAEFIDDELSTDRTMLELADLIDSIGTMKALGVTVIATRKAPNAV